MAETGLSLVVSKEMLANLQKADNAITNLATKSEQAKNRIVAAFTEMGQKGVGAFLRRINEAQRQLAQLGASPINFNFNTANVQPIIDALNRVTQTSSRTNMTINGIDTIGNQANNAIDAINRLVATLSQLQNTGGMQSFNQVNAIGRDTLKEMNKEARKMKRTLDNLDEAMQLYGINASELAKKIQDAREAQRQFNEIAKQQAQQDAGRLLSTQGQQKTLNELKAYAKELERTMNNLNPKSKEWEELNKVLNQTNKQIGEIKTSMKGVQTRSNSLLNISEQLQRRLALLFSVSQITGYINKLVAVRGEFELQQRSLEAILQNKDEANKLWQQTIDLAVKSPFRVKELVTYTKQLAAYRVETEKLHNTTKMLSDVSAGLGVDMQRLILAFGQVKAANYLRGTELRQFSEAGINILGELAKYFSEVEGIAVSVGDVFERVSKRMVSFADVEEIFKRITSEGGTFYRMQEIQSETLKGQISNLKDSIDIMLNDIGKSNENTLKGFVSLFKSLVDNWRVVSATILPILEAMILRWGVFKVMTLSNSKAIVGFTSVFKTFGRHFGIVITQLTRGTRVAKAFTAATGVSIMSGWATVILAVVAALGILIKTIQNANRVKKELEKLDISGAFDASRSIAEYKRLAEVVSDTSKTYDEQQKALIELKNKYDGILPSQLLEEKTIKSLRGNYEDATNTIYEYIAAKTKEKQIGVIQSEYGEDVEEQANDLANSIKTALSKVAPQITKTDVLPIIDKFRELIQSGEIGKTQDIDSVLEQLIKEYTGLEVSSTAWIKTMAVGQGEIMETENKANDLVVAIKEMDGAIREVTNSSLEWHQSFAYQDFNKIKEGYQAQSNAIGKYYETIRKYQDASELKAQGKGTISKQLERDYKFAINELNKIFTEAEQQTPNWNDIINEPFKLNEATINANKILWQKMITEINNMPIDESKKGARANFVELLEEDIKKLKGTAKQQEVKRVAQGLADSMEVSLEGLDELFLKSDESLTEYAERVSSTLEVYKQNILQFDTDVKNKTNFGYYTKEQVDLMKEQVPFLEEYLKFFAAFLKQQKKGAEVDTFTPKLKAVKEIYDAYKKLKNTFDDITAQEGALAKFGNTFKEAFGKTPEEMGFDLFSEEGVKKAYDYLIKQAPDAKKKIQAELAKGEIVWDVRINKKELEDKALLDQIEEMFSGYEISLELQKLNIPKDWARDFFGVKTFDLSQISKKVEDEIAKIGDDDGEKDKLEKLKEFLKKVKEMEVKAQQERLKTYLQYARDAVGDRAKIKLEEMKKLQEIEETFTKPEQEEVKQKAIAKVRADSQKDLNKLEWEEFQKSDTFIDLFDDLDNATSSLLNHSIDKLREFKEQWKDMPLEDMRSIVSKISELEEKMIDIVPIKALATFKDEINDIIKGTTFASKEGSIFAGEGKYISAFEEERKFWEDRKNAQNDEISRLEAILSAKEEGNDASLALLGLSEDEQEIASMTTEEIREMVKEMREMLGISQSNIDKSTRLLKLYGLQDKAWAKMLGYIGEVLSAASDLSNAFSSLNEALGKDSDGMVGAFADAGINAMQMVVNTISLVKQIQSATKAALTFGTAMKLAMGVIGWIVMAVELIANSINKIVSAKDNKLDNQIKTLTRNVEDLDRALAKLEDRIDSAFSLTGVSLGTKDTIKNLQSQIYSYERMIKLEKDKKKTDTDSVRQYEQAIDDLKARQRELEKEAVSSATSGILDSTRDAARQFVDAWYDAFAETGDGLQGLKDNFKEIMLDMIQQQASMTIAGNFLNRWKAQLDKYINPDDLELTTKEASNWMRSVQKELPMLNEALQNYFTAMEQAGLDLSKTGEMSGLQRGIQSVSEETAQALEALLNSTRFFVADSNAKLTLLVDSFTNPESANPMLSELRSQTDLIRTIRDMFSSVIGRGDSTHSGAYLKVVM